MSSRAATLALLSAIAALSCAHDVPPGSPAPPPKAASPFTGFTSARYRDRNMWLCLPGRQDACSRSLDATEIRADGTQVAVRDRRAPGADKVDCFYVYPTVDLRLAPANHEDFSELGPMSLATVAQAARFRNVCSLYVPLYRQVTIGTYFRRPEVKRPYTDVAFSDVADAFLHYMGQHNQGRKIVLLGHSQGGEMTVMLLERFFDDDPVMRERLLIAMPIGWPVEAAAGQTKGGTFAHLPLCTRAGETGCVVSYRSFAAGSEVEPGPAAPSRGRESACVNPAELAHGAGRPFSRTFFPVASGLAAPESSESFATPFLMLRDFYRGRCVAGEGGFRYLEVSASPTADDPRTSPVDLSRRLFRGRLGLHLLDYQFAQGDLMDLVAERAAALP